MPNRQIIAAARRTIRGLPGWPALRVLDLSCGEGRLLEQLALDGCRTEGTHYRMDDYIVKNPSEGLQVSQIHTDVDLSQPLPFDSGQYDVVLATEVLEHLPQHVGLVAEVGRILKPGGTFIFSTPNVHRLRSRLQFLLSGQHELRSARIGWETPADLLYATHFNPVYFPTIHTVLHHHGMRIRRLHFTKARLQTWLLLVLYPFVVLGTLVVVRHQIRRSRAGGCDLLRWQLDWRMLLSEQLMVVARKEPDPAGSRQGDAG